MAAPDSDSDEDLVSYGTGLELLEEGAGQIGLPGLWKTGRGPRSRGENAQPGAGPWLVPATRPASYGRWEGRQGRRAPCFWGAHDVLERQTRDPEGWDTDEETGSCESGMVRPWLP